MMLKCCELLSMTQNQKAMLCHALAGLSAPPPPTSPRPPSASVKPGFQRPEKTKKMGETHWQEPSNAVTPRKKKHTLSGMRHETVVHIRQLGHSNHLRMFPKRTDAKKQKNKKCKNAKMKHDVGGRVSTVYVESSSMIPSIPVKKQRLETKTKNKTLSLQVSPKKQRL